MKRKQFYTIGLKIFALFVLAMSATYIPEVLPKSFFGDTPHSCIDELCDNYCSNKHDVFDNSLEWGVRHYWYFWMCVSLFLFGVVDFFVSVFVMFTTQK